MSMFGFWFWRNRLYHDVVIPRKYSTVKYSTVHSICSFRFMVNHVSNYPKTLSIHLLWNDNGIVIVGGIDSGGGAGC